MLTLLKAPRSTNFIARAKAFFQPFMPNWRGFHQLIEDRAVIQFPHDVDSASKVDGLNHRIPSRFINTFALFGLLIAIYFVVGKFGLSLASVHPSATAVWPPTGLTLVVFLTFGYRVWPAIFIGAFLVNITTAGSVITTLGISAGNTLEGLIGAYFVNRFAGGFNVLNHAGNFLRFIILAALLSTVVSATFGVTSLALGGFARWENYGFIWLTWWLGDGVSNLAIAPFLLAWSKRSQIIGPHGNVLEAIALFLCFLFINYLVFGGPLPNYPLEFLCIPFLLWAAFRFGQRGATMAILFLAAMAIWGTLKGFGPFVRETPHESLLLLQVYIGVASVTTLMLKAVIFERRRAEEQLRHLSVSDPLTGIGNYRLLMKQLQAEIERSQRTRRPFALLFFDLDGLKKINDKHGHLIGSKVLCRVADVLRSSCRAIDTPARFGGDEFALILPETNEEEAWQAGHRITEILANDQIIFPISVSMGVAIYPEDGETEEALLGIADQGLYEMKSLKNNAPVIV